MYFIRSLSTSLVLLGSLTAVGANAQSNLLESSSFESPASLDIFWPTATGVWGAEGGVSITGAENGVTPATGSSMLKATQTGGSNSQTAQIVQGPFIAGSEVTFEIQANSASSGVYGMVSVMKQNGVGGAQSERVDSATFYLDNDASTWESISVTTTITSDWNYANVEIVWWNGGLTGGRAAYTDDAVLTAIAPVVDTDNDGIPDGEENGQCLNTDLSATVSIGGVDSGVDNTFFAASGCAVSDLIDNTVGDCLNSRNHGQFVSCVSRGTNSLKAMGVLTGKEKGAIQRAAAQSDLP